MDLEIDSNIQDDQPEKQEDKALPQHNRKRAPARQKLSKNELEYGNSRRKYLPKLASSPTNIVFLLESNAIKIGFSNRSTQYKKDVFSEGCQTEEITVREAGIQIPEFSKTEKRFPSIMHFLKAATATVMTLLEEGEFGGVSDDQSQFTRISKLLTESQPQKVLVTSTRTYALVGDPAPLGRILVWNALSTNLSYYLISSASPSCFDVAGSLVIAGTETGSILIWDLQRIEKTKTSSSQQGVALIVQPVYSTDALRTKNHRNPFVSIQVFSKNVICASDNSGNTSFWYIRTEGANPELVKAEKIHISTAFVPTFTSAMPPESMNNFVVGGGSRVFNLCRFGGLSSPHFYRVRGAVSSISFNNLDPSIFAVGCESGRFYVFQTSSDTPLLEVSSHQLGKMWVEWSPTRASVLFVGDMTGMKIMIYDFLVGMRYPVYTFKVGSPTMAISAAESNGSTVVGIAESGNCICVYRVCENFSKPLTSEEMGKFHIGILHNS
ncbi:hypothetical protein TRFO_24611 [Tritrichomonas foetus]|uniref:Uncharacterized protein n=1 Tax=Tritrichomonas foetus TaxID=1144522 RepID=A0A1J4K721_9EUKA|nr:hypothetical protein TRFO_24611 [Tritrichomonas foetus]|eukprot:OHT07273.1 hypothetical protein TRFO_24611 [Tritrichomonas foetus]